MLENCLRFEKALLQGFTDNSTSSKKQKVKQKVFTLSIKSLNAQVTIIKKLVS